MTKENQEKVQAIRDELSAQFIERDEQVTGTMCALLSKQHLFMVGPPGTAKSALTEAVCQRIGGANYFSWLLTKFSTPEEVFGPISLKALENDEYKRMTRNKLPEAHIAFLDETFKANSAILNAMLTIVNERMFNNNGAPKKVPLQTLFGASNELPEGEELSALYDRFMLRYVVPYIADDSDFRTMLTAASGAVSTTITLAELEQCQQEAEAVTVPDEIIDHMVKIRNELRNEGVIASDRRFRQSMSILKAHAYIHGRCAVGEEDLAILKHILWSQPAEIKTVQRIIVNCSNPLLNRVIEQLDMAHEITGNIQTARKDDPDNLSSHGVEANAKLKQIGMKLDEFRRTAEAQGRSTTEIDDAIKKVAEMNRTVLKECLGLDI